MSKILVTGAHGFIGKYLIHTLINNHKIKSDEIDTLGISQDNNIISNIVKSVPDISKHYSTVYHFSGKSKKATSPREWIFDATKKLIDGLSINPPAEFVYLSSTEVYGITSGTDITEENSLNPTSPIGIAKEATEKLLNDWCNKYGIKLTILRLPLVIGTGMNGEAMDIAKRIYRGTYRHINGNMARQSVVHAKDVAEAAIRLSRYGGTFNLTDGNDPTKFDFAEAIAHRLNDKKIFSMSDKRANLITKFNRFIPLATFNKKRLEAQTTTLTFSAQKAFDLLDWRPTNVVEYLNSNDYENDPF